MSEYAYDHGTVQGALERHVLEEPEYHEKIDSETGMGTGELDDPHCDWCWDAWPCETSVFAKRLYDLGER